LGKRALAILFIFHPLLVFAFCFDEAAREYGLNASLLRSIATVESNCNPSALSYNRNGSTDLGIMQINSSWIRPMRLNESELLKNPCYNVKTAAKILKKCVEKHGYDWEAIGCYNALGIKARVKYSWRVFTELSRRENHMSGTSSSVSGPSSLHFAVREISETDH